MTDVDVVVVGAGLAGLSAAAAAAAAGFSVVVLEARDRIGGRIDTRRLPTGAVAELGAQVVHGSQNQLLDLPGVLGRAAPIDRSDVQATWVWAGERHGFEEAEAEFCSPTVVAERLRALHARLRPLGLHTLALSQALDMLAVSAPARRAVEGWYEQVTGSPAADVPLAEVASDRVYQYHGDAECEITDGLATIADQLAVGLDVRTSCPVTELTLTEAGGGGVLVVCAGGQRWSGRRAVLAVPPSVVAAGAVRIDALDDAHRSAAAELVLCDAVAVAVGLARPAPADAFVFDADGELGFVTVRRGGRHLIAIAKGSVAQRLRGLTEDPCRLVARLQLALPSCSLTADAACWTHDWGRDPWAYGAFTAPTVASRAASQRWSRPIGNRIFPAGEATACGDGAPFLDRAYRSGVAAVRELMAGLEVAQLQAEVA